MSTNRPEYPKISIVTPNFNIGNFLEQTIDSVLSQGYPNLEYIIIDGGSTDNSVELIKKYEKHLKFWISEPDKGMYDALNKGMTRTSGEIMGWLNSDDMLHSKALFTLAGLFQIENLEWIQGYPTLFDCEGRSYCHAPARGNKYRFYLKDFLKDGHFVQQESTFWKRSLWEKSGSHISTDYKLAGDFELWMRFFRHAELYTTKSFIGGFRLRGKEQLSRNNYVLYVDEASAIIDAELNMEQKWVVKEDFKFLQQYRKNLQNGRLKKLFVRELPEKKYNWILREKEAFFDFQNQVYKLAE